MMVFGLGGGSCFFLTIPETDLGLIKQLRELSTSLLELPVFLPQKSQTTGPRFVCTSQ